MSEEHDYISTNPTKKEKKIRRRGRVEGDSIYYFALHNFISMITFFAIAVPLGLFTTEIELVEDLFSFEFLGFILIIFGLTFLSGILARIIAYVAMFYFTKNVLNKQLKTLGQFNDGINKVGMAFAISLFISSVLFAIGAIAIIESMLFTEQTLITLLATYMLIKLLIFIFVKLLMNAK